MQYHPCVWVVKPSVLGGSGNEAGNCGREPLFDDGRLVTLSPTHAV